jgi:hypothetical protein
MLTRKDYATSLSSYLIDPTLFCVENNPELEEFFEACASGCTTNQDFINLMNSLELFYRMTISDKECEKKILTDKYLMIKNSLENPSEN